tara:strand:- start:546 stop:1055 length:510 start_codon:yes stop_codon:yes gene_type:complete
MFKGSIKNFFLTLIILGFWGCASHDEQMEETLTSQPQLDSPGAALKSEENLEEGEGGTYSSQKIHFDFDKDSIREEFSGILEGLAKELKASKSKKIKVVGHCDKRGTPEYNLGLGNRRAVATKKYLEYLGADASQIETVSMGEESPLSYDNNEEAHALNRRAEFEVINY